MKSNSKDKKDIQRQIFEEIRKELPSRFELARTVSKILKVSTDSVYRRIRGEKDISLKELIILCKHFNLSFDRYLQDNTTTSSFYYPPIRYSGEDNYLTYSQNLMKFLKSIWNIKEKEYVMILSDIPAVHFARYKELALFKSYASSPTLYEAGDFKSYVERADSMRAMTTFNDLSKVYSTIPTVEIWSETTIEPTLRTLKLFYSAGYFNDTTAALLVCSQLTSLVNSLEEWVERGSKTSDPVSSSIRMYLNAKNYETSLFFLQSGPIKLNTFQLSTFNSIVSSDTVFCADTEKFIDEQVKESVLLNDVPRSESTQIFNKMREKISATVDFIKS